ncbi:MAG: TetR/AcrR family transcriptional regulator [Candidatus Geothermincolia bacterium]
MGRLDISAIRRQQITDAAFKVFSEKGYNSTTVSDIASELELGHSTVYRYFDNKLDIASAVIDDVIARAAEAFTPVPPETIASAEDYRNALGTIATRLFDLLEEDPQLIKFLLFEALQIDEVITAKINSAFALFASLTETYLKNGIKRGFLRADIHTRETSYAINGMTMEAVRQLSSLPRITEKDKAVWSETVIGLILGLGK